MERFSRGRTSSAALLLLPFSTLGNPISNLGSEVQNCAELHCKVKITSLMISRIFSLLTPRRSGSMGAGLKLKLLASFAITAVRANYTLEIGTLRWSRRKPSGRRTLHRCSRPSTLIRISAVPAGCSAGWSRTRKSGPSCPTERVLPFRIRSILTSAECPLCFSMTQASQKLLQKAQLYANRYQRTLDQRLGFGTHGTVFSVKGNPEAGKFGRSAIKIYEDQEPYHRERPSMSGWPSMG